MQTAKLPNRDELSRRLKLFDDNSHMVERFYPLLLDAAERELVPPGLVMVIQLAIVDYTDGMPAVMGALIRMRLKDLIQAICGDDLKDFGAAAIDFVATVDARVAAKSAS